MSDNKRSGGLFAGKGYYIALILCAAAIGITGYVYSQSNDKTQEAVIQETYVDIPVGPMDTEDVAVIADIVITQTGFTMEAIRVVEVQ